jgi:lipid-A-disaccharide synthase-like uncharacterized protein
MSLSLSNPNVWLVIGFAGQAIFTGRFLVQWVASERRRDSVVPVAFWWLSLAGGMTLLAYAIHRQDKVFIVGQSTGAFIYVRNLMLVQKGRLRAERQAARAAAALAAPGPELSPPSASAAPPASGAIPRPHLNAHAHNHANGHARREGAPGPKD